MPSHEIGRQEAIHELIYTEDDYVRDLKILDQVTNYDYSNKKKESKYLLLLLSLLLLLLGLCKGIVKLSMYRRIKKKVFPR